MVWRRPMTPYTHPLSQLASPWKQFVKENVVFSKIEMRSLFGETKFIWLWCLVKVRKEAGQTCNVRCQVHLHPHKLFPETSAGTEQVSLFRPSFCLQFREQLLLFGKRQEEYTFQNMCYKPLPKLNNSNSGRHWSLFSFHLHRFPVKWLTHLKIKHKENKHTLITYCLLR